MVYLGEFQEEDCAIWSNNDIVWQHVTSADSVNCVAKEQRLRVWRVAKNGVSSVVKYSTRARTKDAADQIVGENQAAMLLADEGIHPLMVLPVKTIMDPDEGSFSIAPYAGVSAAKMRKDVWTDCTAQEYEQICRTFVVSLMLTQRMMYGSRTHQPKGKRRYLHKDIKLLNTCYNEQFDFFPLVDYGGFSSVCQQVWVNVSDDRYLDCQMARYDAEYDEFAAETDEGLRETTGPTTDIYQTGLAAVELFLGHLPAKIDASKYRGNMRAYYQAVWEYRWDESPELLSMPDPMRSWLLKALAFDPSQRFQSAEEALLDPWLQGAVCPVLKRILAATPGWKKMVSDLKQDLRGGRMMCGSTMEHCSSNSSGSGQGDVSRVEPVAEEASATREDVAGCFMPNPAALHTAITGSCSEDADSIYSGGYSRGVCFDADAAQCHAHHSSLTLTAVAAEVAAKGLLESSATSSSDGSQSGLNTPSEEEHHHAASYDSDDSSATQALGETCFGFGAIGHDVAPADAEHSSLVSPAPYGLFEPHGWDLTSHFSQLSSYPYPAASDSTNNGFPCAATALSDSVAVGDSSLFSDYNHHNSLSPNSGLTWGTAGEVNGSCSVTAAAAAAYPSILGSLDLLASGSDGNSSSRIYPSHAAAACELADSCVEEADGYCSVLPAAYPSSDLIKDLQGLGWQDTSYCGYCSSQNSSRGLSGSIPVPLFHMTERDSNSPTWSVSSSGSDSALPTDNSSSISSNDACGGSSSTTVHGLKLVPNHGHCLEVAVDGEDHKAQVLPTLPQLESHTTATAADNAVQHESSCPLVVTADKSVQVDIAKQNQGEQQVHAVVQPLSDHREQQQVHSECNATEVVLVAGSRTSSQSQGAGASKMKAGLKIAAGVVVALLAAWQYKRHS